jgi:hypothetical protein
MFRRLALWALFCVAWQVIVLAAVLGLSAAMSAW